MQEPVVFMIYDSIHPYKYDNVQHTFNQLALKYSATINMQESCAASRKMEELSFCQNRGNF